MSSFRARHGILTLVLVGWLPLLSPARGAAQDTSPAPGEGGTSSQQACTGFGDPQLNNPSPPEGGGGWGALVPLYPNTDCSGWAVSVPSWIHISGIYNTLRNNQWYGHFFYTVDPNTLGQARSTSLLVYQPGTSYESPLAPINQPPCTYGITGQPQQALPGEGGTYAQMQVNTQSGCPNQPAQQPSWIRFQGQSTAFDYDPNGSSARSGLLAFGGQNVTIQQASLPAQTYRITSKAILPTSHIVDPLDGAGHRCDGAVDSPVRTISPLTWLRGDNHALFDPAPDGAFSGPGLNGTTDARTLDQVEFTWNGHQLSNVDFFHNIIESHRDFTYHHGDLFFSCEEAGQASSAQRGTYSILPNGDGHIELNSSVAIPSSLVSAAPNLDTNLQADIDAAHNLTISLREDRWTQGFRVERKLANGSWMTLRTDMTSEVSCVDLYGPTGAAEAIARLFDPPAIGQLSASVTFNLPAIRQTQLESIWDSACLYYPGDEWWHEPCALHTILPSLAEFSAGSQQSRSVLGATWPSCTWTAQSNASWLTPQAASGTGSGAVGYSLAANTAAECRYGSITYSAPGGSWAKLSVSQRGLGPATHWNAAADFRPEGLSNPSSDCHGNPEVWTYMASNRGDSRSQVWALPVFRHDGDCSAGSRSYWKSASNTCDVGIGREGLGSRLLLTPSFNSRAAVAWRNPGAAGYFNVAGNIHDEGGQGGHWYIDQGSAPIISGDLPGGANQTFNETFQAGAGETVLFTYEDNPGFASEASVDLTVAPAADPCSLIAIQPTDVNVDAGAQSNQALSITATQAGCTFSAQTSSPGQLTIAGADSQGRLNGITGAGGAASLTYGVGANTGQDRQMTIQVSMGQTARTFTVYQSGVASCQVTGVNPSSQMVDSGAHSLDLIVTTTTPSCPFTVTRTAGGNWLALPGGGSTYAGTTGANGQTTVQCDVLANPGAQRTGTLNFSPTQQQSVLFNLTQQTYAPPTDPCAQGWSSDSYVPEDLTFTNGAGGPVQFRVNPPAGCEYKAIERCGSTCFTSDPRLDNSLSSHVGAYTYTTNVPGLNRGCTTGSRRTIYIDVKTTNDGLTRSTITIYETCDGDSPGNPGEPDGGDNPAPEPAPDPDQWNNGSCLPSREASISGSSAGTDGTMSPPTIEQQVDALAESLGKEYRARREEILATSGDTKTDLEALDQEMADRFEQGTINIYSAASLGNPFDPGCRLSPADQ